MATTPAPTPLDVNGPRGGLATNKDVKAEVENARQITTKLENATGMPSRPESTLRYDDRGRALKGSIQYDSRVGAYAVTRTAPSGGRRLSFGRSPTSNSISSSNNNNEQAPNNMDNENQESQEPPSEEEDTRGPWWKQKTCLIIGLGIILVLIVAVVIAAVLLAGGSAEDPVELYIPPEEEEGLDLPLVPNLTDSTLLALEDPFSVQSLAYDWITIDDNWETYENWRKQQRFAMACLYYAFGAPRTSSSYTYHFLFRTKLISHECDWEPMFPLCPENDGIIRSLGNHLRRPTQSGYFPPEISFLSSLEVIRFTEINWNLPLESMFPPDTTTHLPLLRELKLVNGEIKGTIPTSLGLLTRLEYLDLCDNKLTSTIPSQLGLLSDLHTLVLSLNDLSGSLPEEIGALPLLKIVQVDGNPSVESFVPSGFCLGNQTSWESLVTDWCLDPDECCGE